jgi:biopolymer transport protein ExbD
MRHWHDEQPHRSRIEIIPMIDVMMFLLAIFVLISVNVIPALGIKTKLPQSSAAQQLDKMRKIVVTLGTDGILQVDGKSVPLAGLAAALAESAPQSKPDDSIKTAVLINGDGAVELQRVIEVVDVLKAGGYDSFSIATKKKSG